MNAVLYARVSTDKQADKDLSIPAQLQAMRDYAGQQGYIVVEEYVEPGVSAKTADRPELQRLLARIRVASPPVQAVIVHKIDRLTRNVYDHATIKAVLQKQGARLLSVVENIQDTTAGHLVENIMASFAEFYSSNLSEEVKKGMRQKVLNGGWPHRPPRGYMVTDSPSGNRIDLHPGDAPLMAKAFALYGTGLWSLKQVAASLFSEGLTGDTGRPLAAAHLRRLLSNSFYVGRVHWHEVEVPGSHAPLVSAELFAKVQQVLEVRHQNPGPRGSVIRGFSLRGIALCASCGGRMTGERHGKWRYYRCSRQTYQRALCSARFCNTKKVEADLEAICRRLHIRKELVSKIEQATKPLIEARLASVATTVESRDRQLKADIKTIQDLTLAFTNGAIDSDTFTRETARAKSRGKEPLDAAPSGGTSTAANIQQSVRSFLRLAHSMWDVYAALPDYRRGSLMRVVFASAVINETGIAGYVLRKPFDQLAGALSTEEAAAALVDAA